MINAAAWQPSHADPAPPVGGLATTERMPTLDDRLGLGTAHVNACEGA
jgi:hypothetical protein